MRLNGRFFGFGVSSAAAVAGLAFALHVPLKYTETILGPVAQAVIEAKWNGNSNGELPNITKAIEVTSNKTAKHLLMLFNGKDLIYLDTFTPQEWAALLTPNGPQI